MNSITADLAQIIRSSQGFDISRYDDSFVIQNLKRRQEMLQIQDVSNYFSLLSKSDTECFTYVQSLENNYTDFFRSGLVFAQLEHWILPGLIDQLPANRELRVWSAGCSTGQEPYSLAILLENLSEKRLHSFRYRIIATDFIESALDIARKGEYSQESVQNLRLKDISTYFSYANGMYVVSDRLKRNLAFSVYNLFDSSSAIPPDSIFGNFNLVICSNVLIYYNDSAKQHIIHRLGNSLDENGFLITGEAERNCVSKKSNLCGVTISSPIFKKVFEVHHETEQP